MATPSVDVARPDEAGTGRLEGASRLRVILIILAIVLATEVGTYYFTFVSMATPYIGADFPQQSAGQLTWMSTLYAIVGGVLVPVAGKLSDRLGKKKIILACLGTSLIGSVLVAVTSTWPLMLLGRGLQAVAFPAIFVSYGLIRDLMPRRHINMAIALAGGGTGVGAVLGPVAGGLLTDHFSWRSLFWFCVGWTVVTIIPLAILVPETKLRVKSRIDWVGAVLLGAGIGGVLIYLSQGVVWGWASLCAGLVDRWCCPTDCLLRLGTGHARTDHGPEIAAHAPVRHHHGGGIPIGGHHAGPRLSDELPCRDARRRRR